VSGTTSTFTPTQSRFARLASPFQGEVKKV
jgi:hypothetical protein